MILTISVVHYNKVSYIYKFINRSFTDTTDLMCHNRFYCS